MSESGVESEIAFPAFRVNQNLIQSVDSLDRVSECSKLALKKGFYRGLKLIDSLGRKFLVINAGKIHMLPPKPTFGSILGLVTGNPHFRVQLVFSPRPTRTLALEDVKQIIFDSFLKEKNSWEAMVDFDEFRDKISAETSLKQVLAIFRDYHV